ncbi:restriction endonuclease subunit S [Cutibacterium avidum]|uniref:restriction endonuclease subunit S n=1 Tax=Cutibacterium avidum TaxID=33010 RepID=UPI00288A7405|nr:restriction endonuclease subunit S [Cutibacterium avidum]
MMQYASLGELGVMVLDCEHRTPSPAPAGHPYVAIPDIQQGRVVLETTRRITDEDLLDWTRRTKPRAGDILVTRRGRVGDTAPIPTDDCAIGQNLVILRSDGTVIDQSFLRWATRGPAWQSEVDRLINVGAVFSSLNVGDIGKMRIPVLPLPEQQAIAEVLGALDDKIAANRALVATADALARAFTNECLADSTTTQLCDLATITMGSSPKGTSYNESGEGVVLYQGMKDFGIRSPLPRVWTTEPGRLAHAGDILMSVRAPVGTLNRATEECCIGRGLASLTAHQPNALFHLLLGQQTLFAPFNGDGTIFGSINKRQLHALPVRIPSAGLTELEAKTAPLEAQVASALSESATLAALRDTLLPALMDGTLRVKDAEKTVSEAL